MRKVATTNGISIIRIYHLINGETHRKIKDDERTNYTQVEAEATLVFPLLVAGAFSK